MNSRGPKITIPRTRFKMPFNHATSFQHGKLIPIDCMEIIPGDEISLKLSDLVRMSTPIVPLFGNIKMHVAAFFVPFRLLWSEAEKFYGDPSNHNVVQSITPVAPDSVRFPYWSDSGIIGSYGVYKWYESVANYLGKPILPTHHYSGNFPKLSCMKEAGYYMIYNEHFRPSNIVPPCILSVSTGGNSSIGYDWNSAALVYDSPVLSVAKNPDYFTASTLQPQFGDSITLPLGTFGNAKLPVSASWSGGSATFPNNTFMSFGTQNVSGASISLSNGDILSGNATYSSSLTPNTNAGSIFASTSGLTLGTINELRYAVQVQRYLERNNYGSHYFQLLQAHYGVTSPDGRLQRPDKLGYSSFYINVNQVLSTAGAAADDTTKLGQPGAVSVTAHTDSLMTAAFTEPGYLYIMAWTRYDRSYCTGCLREDLRAYRFDFYSPEFANLGDQDVKEIELRTIDGFNTNTSTFSLVNDSKVFGYQEHWAEYRYRKDRISGILNPDLVNYNSYSALPFWTLADNFNNYGSDGSGAALPDLLAQGPDFVLEDREALARALVTGTDGPDYIADFYFDYKATRELPLVSVPGLMDHIGAW